MDSFLDNPLREGLGGAKRPEPCAMVIFGARGDLSQRKLLPALYHLRQRGELPTPCAIVGFARKEQTADDFRGEVEAALKQFAGEAELDPAVWQTMAASVFYSVGDFGDHDSYVRLRQHLDQLDREQGTQGNRLYYLAAPPRFFGDIVHNLGAAGLVYTGNQGAQLLGPGQRLPSLPTPGAPEAWSRVVVEKPFGRDLASAQELNRVVGQSFSEDQIYRIDHYLGKETVQNILVLRFANGIFEPLWSQKYIDHVQITVAEDIGVGTRGDYFDAAGILRDMVQNHMLQLLCLTAMEPPVAFDADAVRGEKVKVLRALRPLVGEAVATHTARGQYGPGWAQGEHVAGYREAPDVAPDSQTETYVALKVFVDNWRWAGVPFYLRAGKRLPKRVTEIAIQFKAIPYSLLTGSPESDVAPNVLVLRLQPDEGISLRIGCKAPGPAVAVQPVKMEFLYGTAFGFEPPEAYERLLFDVLTGDSTLFTRRDEVEAAWRWITPVLDYWHRAPAPEFPNYAAGTWGPPEAEELIEADGRAWRRS